MTDYVDEQKIGTGLAQRAIDRVLSVAEGAARDRIAKSRNRSQDFLSQYISKKRALLSMVRNNLYFSAPIRIEEIYVETQLSPASARFHERFSFDQERASTMTDRAFMEKLTQRIEKKDHRPLPALNVHGIAGMGKSLFMRNLFLDLTQSKSQFIPIFIELRDLNRIVPGDLENAIRNELEQFGSDLMPEQIADGLQTGLFALLFDGFDELKVVLQNHYEREVERFTSTYPESPIVISGRPIESKYTWRQFETFDIIPLDRARARDLVGRLSFDDRLKKEFLRQMDTKWFAENREFARIPLLLNVMLIAFSQVGPISPRKHEFLEDAFNALWNRHDATKDAFSRQRLLNVSKIEFVALVSAFAASAYADEEIEFDEDSLFEHLKIAANIVDPEDPIDLDALKDDLIVTTCLIVRDGTNFKFLHRYFQEYFTAVYISKMFDGVKESIEEVSIRYESDNVLQLLLSIDPEKFERGWVIPKYKSISKKLNLEKTGFRGYWDALVGDPDWSGTAEIDLLRWPGRFFDILRVVYDLEPKLSTLQGSLSTLSGDQEDDYEAPLINIDGYMTNPLEKDYQNQLELRRKIFKKYAGRLEKRKVLFGGKK